MRQHCRTAKWIPCQFALLTLLGCGHAEPLETGTELEPVVLGGGGASRTQGTIVTEPTPTATATRTPRPQPTPIPALIYPLTFVVEATEGIEGWQQTDLPFTPPAIPFVPNPLPVGWVSSDRQTPLSFVFEMPDNGFEFHNAHFIVDTSRDTTDTEGIFVDGVFSGKPPWNFVNTTSTKITDAVYAAMDGATTQGPGTNTYYIDWSLSHYKHGTRNTFDLDLADLLAATSRTPLAALEDGFLPIVLGDDSPVYQAVLVVNGFVVSKVPLECTESAPHSFVNTLVHNDGNSVEMQAFPGTVGFPSQIYPNPAAFDSVEFFFDVQLPRVGVDHITVDTASLVFPRIKHLNEPSAIVINGVGISESGFVRAGLDPATYAVEEWEESQAAQDAWSAFVSSIPATGTEQLNQSLDLVALLGAARVKSLFAQGKFNVAMAGGLRGVYGQAATAARAFRTAVAGPELKLSGSFTSEECVVPPQPPDPTPIPDEDGEEPVVDENGEPVVINDGAGPLITSVQIMDVTNNSARIIWQTDESSTSQVAYGIGSPSGLSAKDATLVKTHQVRLTGLSSYKIYSFQVISVDQFGNESRSAIAVFSTLR